MSCKDFFSEIGGYNRRLAGVKSYKQSVNGFQGTRTNQTLIVIQW
jgi:hypothetical protein